MPTPLRPTARPLDLVVYSDAGELGGAEMVLSRLLTSLPEQIRVTLVGVDAKVLDWLAGHRPDTPTRLVEPVVRRGDVAGMLRHRRVLRELRPDVVQFNLSSASSCQWPMLAAATIPGLRLVAVENSSMGTWSRTSSRLKRLTSRRLAAHVAVGDRTARLIEENSSLRPGSIRTIHHGIEPPEPRPVDRPEAPTVLTVARHDPVKGVDVLLDAMALVAEPVRAVVMGDGPERASLERRLEELRLNDRVELRSPAWGDMTAAAQMWAFDALVLPSRLEGFPVTVVEAMFAGIPVIATDVGSVREQVLPGATGWVVPPEDPAALAAAIEGLVADPERSRAMGLRGQEVARERFTIDATVDAYVDLYDKILRR